MNLNARIISQIEFEKENFTPEEYLNGIVIIWDKTTGCTSHDVVWQVRKQILNRAGIKIKVGHCGTLDPLASGLLLILIGNATKLQSQFMEMDKKYVVSMVLGYVSDSYDIDGEVREFKSKNIFPENIDEIEKLVATKLVNFRGQINQQVPIYSAVKIRGKKLYEYARAGKNVPLPIRKVQIYKVKILSVSESAYLAVKGKKGMEVEFEVECSSGTYIRSLVHDLGKELGWGAVVCDLRRVAIGEYHL